MQFLKQLFIASKEDIGYNLIARYFGLMLNGLIGAKFERGLDHLKEEPEE